MAEEKTKKRAKRTPRAANLKMTRAFYTETYSHTTYVYSRTYTFHTHAHTHTYTHE